MEPISIFGLAVNILQVVDFSTKLLREAHELHQSTTGQKAEYVELQQISESLSGKCDTIETTQNDQSGLGSDDLQISKLVTSLEKRKAVADSARGMSEIATSAKKVAQDLIAVIQKLKLSDGPKKRWKSFRQAVATFWNRDEIERLQRRLGELRGQLQTIMVSHTRATLEKLDSPRIDPLSDLLERVKNIRKVLDNQLALENVEILLKTSVDIERRFNLELSVLDSLSYETMSDRYHSIPEAHRKTFRWIFKPDELPPSDARSQITFKEWLVSGSGVYWVSGKPGSGKSTLMRYLCDCSQTRICLQTWAGTQRLAAPSFYFWISGTLLQRSQRGLLRQLLYEIFLQFPETISLLCPERLSDSPQARRAEWTLESLRTAFGKLDLVTSQTKICFFIDGLDEYDGDHLELIKTIRELSVFKNIKLCVSSRRWPCFEDAFGKDPLHRLYLEDLTREDIRQFAHDNLLKELPSGIGVEQKPAYLSMIDAITSKAQGVFLWVFLVVRSLRNGISNGDNVSTLQRRLEEIPADLELFFEKIIESVDRVYRRQLAVTFRVALAAPNPMNLFAYWLLDEEEGWTRCALNNGASCSVIEIIQSETTMSRRLYGRYKGLLEAVGTPGTKTVNFLHRTVRDYLMTGGSQPLLNFSDLDPCSKMCKALVAFSTLSGSANPSRCKNLEEFFFLARCAMVWNEYFDSALIEAMRQAELGSFGTDSQFCHHSAVNGFVPGLACSLSASGIIKDPNGLLLTALRSPGDLVKAYFGWYAFDDMLVWLLENEAWSSIKNREIRIEILYAIIRRCKYETNVAQQESTPAALAHSTKNWERCIRSILQQGADLHVILNDHAEFFSLLSNAFGGCDASLKNWRIITGPQEPYPPTREETMMARRRVRFDLDILLNAYSILLRNGLDPNRVCGNFSIWKAWIWNIAMLQTSHGLFEDACAKAIRVFLMHGANPYETVWFESDLTYNSAEEEISVSEVIHRYFEEYHRRELSSAWDAARSRWDNEPLQRPKHHPQQFASASGPSSRYRSYHRQDRRKKKEDGDTRPGVPAAPASCPA
ncbi:hypothetical protein BCR34DRAFT_591070 [Clohesyomyces aquaticus]|uniref:Uncharacterized protein n=1 Tax=Clohesyomyces aquaticus TaxID=1231657 RepID=A0A1Y1Z4F2_9PLEO|nr:hypothetical protein BCR34DRAFT_591070 [Clohesyomyces aquaticus]